MSIVPYSFEFYAVFWITVFTVIVKVLVAFYVGKKLYDERKQKDPAGLDFMRALFILVVCMIISRIIFILFDFVYTLFVFETYYLSPNVWLWKAAMGITGFGLGYVLLITDKKIMENKFRGVLAYIVFFGIVLTLVWPVNRAEDFSTLSLIAFIPQLSGLIIPLLFLRIGYKSSGDLKKTAYVMVIATILYVIGGLLVNAAILEVLTDLMERDMMLTLHVLRGILKSVGVVLFAYVATKFRA